ncbi:erythromycin esterase family protein [Pontibacter sp. 13R65]|uniref:erythromycin esterase family protein n=1 Tax=Pontibacter sp. 13R65 TaxID=3127458 RepID=UPI00301C161C
MNVSIWRYVWVAILTMFVFTSRAQNQVYVKELSGRYENHKQHDAINYQPVAELIQGKRVAGFGESSHGTWDFYYINTELIKYMVSHKLCSAVILEVPFVQGLKINEFVTTGQGNIKDLMNGIGKPPPVKDLVEWLREYNLKPENSAAPVQFYGMDVQGSKKNAYEYLNSCVSKGGAAAFPQMDALLKAGNSKKDTLLNAYIAHVEGPLKKLRDTDLLAYKENKTCEILLNVLKQSKDFDAAGPFAFAKIRDKFLAENVAFIERNLIPNGKTIFVWAHNGHIRSGGKSMLQVPMGHHLKQEYGEQYASVALDFVGGSVFVMKNSGTTVNVTENKESKFIRNLTNPASEGVLLFNITGPRLENSLPVNFPNSYKLHSYDVSEKTASFKTKEDFDAIILINNVRSLYEVKH